jgi:hypothetical protein
MDNLRAHGGFVLLPHPVILTTGAVCLGSSSLTPHSPETSQSRRQESSCMDDTHRAPVVRPISSPGYFPRRPDGGFQASEDAASPPRSPQPLNKLWESPQRLIADRRTGPYRAQTPRSLSWLTPAASVLLLPVLIYSINTQSRLALLRYMTDGRGNSLASNESVFCCPIGNSPSSPHLQPRARVDQVPSLPGVIRWKFPGLADLLHDEWSSEKRAI